MISDFHGQYKKLKTLQRSPEQRTVKKLSDFKINSNRLFDISTRKSSSTEVKCNCVKERKVPKYEIQFLKDQRGPRKMVISSSVNVLTSQKEKKRVERKESDAFV